MFKAIKFIFAALICAAAVIVAYAATKPDSFAVERSIAIKAPADKIFPLINSLRSMNTWNPFVSPDPNIKISYSGPESGKGAAHDWDGNSDVGAGRIEITDSAAPSRVTMRLDMARPLEAHNTVNFTLEPGGDGTKVTWSMSGQQPLMAKIMSVFIDCDKMVGSQFEKGLAKLKSLSETT